MSRYAGGITVPIAFARSLARWKDWSFPRMLRSIERRMSKRGPTTLGQVTGKAWANVQSKSRKIPLGMSFGTTSPYLIAWMEGSSRKSYWVAPKRAKMLSWVGKDGVRRFSYGHRIPAWKFRPVRPVIQDGIEEYYGASQAKLNEEMMDALGELFPDIKDEMKIRLGGAISGG